MKQSINILKEVKHNLNSKLEESINKLDISSYQDALITLTINTFYDLQTENLDTAINNIGIVMDDIEDGEEIYERAIEIQGEIINNINHQIKHISSTNKERKLELISKSFLKDISPESISRVQSFFYQKIFSSNEFKSDLMTTAMRLAQQENEPAVVNFTKLVKDVESDFKLKNQSMMKELTSLERKATHKASLVLNEEYEGISERKNNSPKIF